MAVCLLAVGDAAGPRRTWRRRRRWSSWGRWHEPPESVGEPIAFGQSPQPGRSSQPGTRPARARPRPAPAQHRTRPAQALVPAPARVRRTRAGTRPSTGARPSAGDLQNFLDMPKPSTGAIGGAGGCRDPAARIWARRWAPELPVALPPRSCRTEAPQAVRQPVNFLLARIVRPQGGSIIAPTWREIAPIGPTHALIALQTDRARPIAPTGSRTAKSIATIGSTGETRFAIKSTITRSTTSGRSIPAGPPCGSPVPIVGPPGARSLAGSATAGANPSSYGYGENVYYEGDSVYYGDQVVATAEEYTQQAETIAASAPEAPPANADWMPLGVFALTPDGQASGPDPTLFLQLAISKEGIISGTLNNSATEQTQTIEGMADKTSQRCAWTVAGKSRPIMETGISNLTEDTAPALVHFEDGQTQQWLMVRLEEPAAPK